MSTKITRMIVCLCLAVPWDLGASSTASVSSPESSGAVKLPSHGVISGLDAVSGGSISAPVDTGAIATSVVGLSAGSLQVLIEPAGARTAGARWRRVGTAVWHKSGDIEENVPPGTYRIEFRTLTNWTSPARPKVVIDTHPLPTLTTHYAERRGAVWHVDNDNQSALHNGSAKSPYASVQAAVKRAASGDTIKVAVGAYAFVDTRGKALTILGGYPGANAADYSAGRGGNFAQRALDPAATTIRGSAERPGVIFTRFDAAPYHGVLDNLRISNGRKGIVCDTESSWPPPENLTISNVIVENNGQVGETSRGAGILVCGKAIRIMNSIIRKNHGGRGAGISGTSENLLVADNRIEENVCYDDHSGGVYLSGKKIRLSRNLVAGNRINLNYGWGGGILIVSAGTTAYLDFNIIRDNYAPSYGGGIFVDEGASAYLSHDLLYRNHTLEDGGIGGAVAVDDGEPGPSYISLNNCTVAYNNASSSSYDGWRGGNGIFIDNRSTADVTNTIFWGNVDDFYVRDGSTLNVKYSLSREDRPGNGNLSANPLFADQAAGDFHLRSKTGLYDPATGKWVKDAKQSPAIDAGDPAALFDLEPLPNGGRINLGNFGNTPEASLSLP